METPNRLPDHRFTKCILIPLLHSTRFAFILAAIVSVAAAEDPIVLNTLSPHDSLHVIFSSRGCFHHSTYEFTFQHKKALTATVEQIDTQWNAETKAYDELGRKEIGTLTLSKKEILGLDRLFAYYRTMKEGGCTTVDEVQLTLRTSTPEETIESYSDDTCGTFEMPDVTTFQSLVERLKQ